MYRFDAEYVKARHLFDKRLHNTISAFVEATLKKNISEGIVSDVFLLSDSISL